MPGRLYPSVTSPAQIDLLKVIVPIEYQYGRFGQLGRGRTGCEPVADERTGRPGLVSHGTESLDRAARHGRGGSGNGGHHQPLAQQLGALPLITPADVEEQTVTRPGQGREEPRGQAVGVDGYGQDDGAGRLVRPQVTAEVGGDGLDLVSGPENRLPGWRCSHRLRTGQQHSTHCCLEGLDSLADGRRGDVQLPGCCVEGSFRDGRCERGQPLEVDPIQTCH